MTFHVPPQGIGRAAFMDAHMSSIMQDRSVGLPGVIADAAYAGGETTAKPGGAAPADATAMFFAAEAFPIGHWTPNSARIRAAQAAAAKQPPPPPRIAVEFIAADGFAADGPLSAKAGSNNFMRRPDTESFSEFRERIVEQLHKIYGREAIVIWPELVK